MLFLEVPSSWLYSYRFFASFLFLCFTNAHAPKATKTPSTAKTINIIAQIGNLFPELLSRAGLSTPSLLTSEFPVDS